MRCVALHCFGISHCMPSFWFTFSWSRVYRIFPLLSILHYLKLPYKYFIRRPSQSAVLRKIVVFCLAIISFGLVIFLHLFGRVRVCSVSKGAGFTASESSYTIDQMPQCINVCLSATSIYDTA